MSSWESALNYRPAVVSDAKACVVLRGQTRENAISEERLAALGITVSSWGDAIDAGRLQGHVCGDRGQMIGYCFADRSSGEIVVLAILPNYEGRGIGKTLLSKVIADLRACGYGRLFLGCSKDPDHRSYGFYRHLGWRTTGCFDSHDDEILELL